MGNRIWKQLLILAAFVFPAAHAADIEVAPGDGTLAAAIATASGGDTLILRIGQYTGDTVVDRSLVIRADTRLEEPYISGTFNVQGDGIEVTLQGLHFNTNLVLTQAADVRVLENRFHAEADIDGTAYTAGGSKLTILGNWFSENSEILNVGAYGAYVAGNTLLHGRIVINAPAWVVGNKATYTNGAAISVSAEGAVRVLGNRLTHHTFGQLNSYGVYIGSASSVLISGNLIQMTWGVRSTAQGIYVVNADSFVEAINNTIFGSPQTSAYQALQHSDGVVNADRISGNIIVSLTLSAISGGTSSNNLCFANGTNCGTSDGNLEVDPEFIDTEDFRLAENSPAIDAGSEDPIYADLDRTRNDMGAYGGPWSIEQFDIQRDPSNLGPYVYPLFDANDAFGDGGLNIRVLSVARLR